MTAEGPTAVPFCLACVFAAIAPGPAPSFAFDPGSASALPDPGQQVRARLPLVPDPGGEISKGTQGVFPFDPIDRDPTDGQRHRRVQTSHGNVDARTAMRDSLRQRCSHTSLLTVHSGGVDPPSPLVDVDALHPIEAFTRQLGDALGVGHREGYFKGNDWKSVAGPNSTTPSPEAQHGTWSATWP